MSTLHPLIEAADTATELHGRYRANADGSLWKLTQLGWLKVGQLADPNDAEDLLLAKLSQR